jgi:hypothetical protein
LKPGRAHATVLDATALAVAHGVEGAVHLAGEAGHLGEHHLHLFGTPVFITALPQQVSQTKLLEEHKLQFPKIDLVPIDGLGHGHLHDHASAPAPPLQPTAAEGAPNLGE